MNKCWLKFDLEILRKLWPLIFMIDMFPKYNCYLEDLESVKDKLISHDLDTDFEFRN